MASGVGRLYPISEAVECASRATLQAGEGRRLQRRRHSGRTPLRSGAANNWRADALGYVVHGVEAECSAAAYPADTLDHLPNRYPTYRKLALTPGLREPKSAFEKCTNLYPSVRARFSRVRMSTPPPMANEKL